MMQIFRFLLLLLLSQPLLAAPDWQRLTPELLTQAKAQNRLVLVDLSAEWCHFCAQMDRDTWPDPRVQATIARHYLAARIDDERQPALAEKYRHYGRPAFFVLDADGREIARKRGYLDGQFMHWMLEGIAAEAGL